MSPKLTGIDVSSDYNWRTTFFSPEKTLFHESIFCFVFLVTSSLDHLIELRFSNLLKWCRKVLCSSAFGVAEHPKLTTGLPWEKELIMGLINGCANGWWKKDIWNVRYCLHLVSRYLFQIYLTLWMLILATKFSVEGLLSAVINTFCLDKLEKTVG